MKYKIFYSILLLFSFVVFKIIGQKISSNLSGKLFEKIERYFRQK